MCNFKDYNLKFGEFMGFLSRISKIYVIFFKDKVAGCFWVIIRRHLQKHAFVQIIEKIQKTLDFMKYIDIE